MNPLDIPPPPAGYGAFAPSLMTLAAFAYADANQIGGLLRDNTPPPASPPGATEYATQGRWALVWGPARSRHNSNQMYVAYNADAPAYAVAVRGTEPSWTVGGLLQLYEDLEVDETVAWSYPPTPGALIAKGTDVGLKDLLGMADPNTGESLLEYLTANVSTAPVFVTGHSLGGCLASVLALYLDYELSQAGVGTAVIPYTFAGPTAGNQAFADLFDGLTQFSRYYNTLDAIPFAWADLSGIVGLYEPTVPCPSLYRDIIDHLNKRMTEYLGSDTFYVQPGQPYPLPGTIMPVNHTGLVKGEKNFDEEIGDQHDHNYYLALLGAPTVPTSIP
ncbi:MAG TPA: hypothetical protein VF588_10185 [Pyrinomonadaceae bacterium]|jgi:hypothetical protein